jgi:hypothetical protein
MPFNLASIKPTKTDHPVRVLLYGQPKIGKTTWAANAPDSIIIQTEDGSDAVDAESYPLCEAWDDVMACVRSLYTEDHAFKTVVLDTADWAEKLAHKKVSKDNQVNSIDKIGYGKGYTFAGDLFNELLGGLNALRLERGMIVIIIAHSEIRRFDDPMADSYDRYQIKLHKVIAKLVMEWCDVIGFAQLDTMTTEKKGEGFKADRTRAMDTGTRVLRLAPGAAYDAGSRFDLPPTLPLIWADFEAALKKAKGHDNG